jgi:outer membrane receptor protein involved in Fe transport
LQGTYATPKWRGSTTLAFEQGPFNARVLFNLIGGGKYDNNYGPLDISRNKYPAYLYTDVSVQYDLTENLQIYAKVENLTDTDPPLLADSTITVASATLSQFHDLRGRVVGVGARLRF